MQHDVFISYSSHDKAAADAVCATLEANGVRCWVAPRDIKPGESWAASILHGIAECRLMVLVFSAHTNDSKHIPREVERAVHRGIPIAPLRVDDAMPTEDLEYFLSSSHWMDALTPPMEKHLREFAQSVRGLLEVAGGPPAAAPNLLAAAVPARRRRRVAALLWLGVALAGLAAAAWVYRGELVRRLAGALPIRLPAQQPAAASLPATVPASTPSVPTLPRKTFTNSIGMNFIGIGPGEFLMGSPASEAGRDQDETQHKVSLTKPFFMGAHLVTRGHFAAFVRDTAYRTGAERDGWGYCLSADGLKADKIDGASWRKPGFDQTDEHPVVEVSWNDTQAFCRWLSGKDGKRYRLPTEAEWEYACRAGTHTAYFWGDDPGGIAGFANCADLALKESFPNLLTFNWRDGFVYTSPVGSFKPNPWGLHDMIGNVWELCGDYYAPYGDGAAVDPAGPARGDSASSRVWRGGAWNCYPKLCRAASRLKRAGDARSNIAGFRVCVEF